jgi:hypothetical protein
MNEDWIYCYSRLTMPDILHVGITKASPETDYKFEFAKKEPEPSKTEKAFHHVLKEYRICPDKNLFCVSLDIVRKLFGVGRRTLTENCEEVEVEVDVEVEVGDVDESAHYRTGTTRVPGCRDIDISTYFTHGQRIRHVFKSGNKRTWIGVYDSSNEQIVCNGLPYKSVGAFTNAHYKSDGRKYGKRDGWGECEYEVNGQWIHRDSLVPLLPSLHSLPS